jgi:hypothetical protein
MLVRPPSIYDLRSMGKSMPDGVDLEAFLVFYDGRRAVQSANVLASAKHISLI